MSVSERATSNFMRFTLISNQLRHCFLYFLSILRTYAGRQYFYSPLSSDFVKCMSENFIEHVSPASATLSLQLTAAMKALNRVKASCLIFDVNSAPIQNY